MAASDAYAAGYGQGYFTGVPGFRDVKSDLAQQAFAAVQQQNAQVARDLAVSALSAKAEVERGRLALESQKSVNATELQLEKLRRKPTLAQKLQALANMASTAGAAPAARLQRGAAQRDMATTLLASAGAKYVNGTGLDRANTAISSLQDFVSRADTYSAPAMQGAAQMGKAVNDITAPTPSIELPAGAFTAESVPQAAPAPVYEYKGAQAPSVSAGGGDDAYLKWMQAYFGKTG